MGADPEYCLQYFQSGGGVCEKVSCGKCIKHRSGFTPLPRGKVCSMEFASMAVDLRHRVSEMETRRQQLKHEWDQLKTDEGAAVYLETLDCRQVGLWFRGP